MTKKLSTLLALKLIAGLLILIQPVFAQKLGFLVKQAEEPWFQTEWAFADKAAKELNIEVLKIAVPDGEKTLNAIDSLAANGVKGFVICLPDPKLGTAIMAKANQYGMKVIAVDDQFFNAKGEPMTEVPLLMMAATKIGERQGQELYKEMQHRGWNVAQTGVLVVTADELDTARRRTTGSMDALIAAGFPQAQIYKVPTKSNDIPGALDAANSLLVQHPTVKNWLVVGMNDNTVLGAIRATEGQGFKADNIIGICITVFKDGKYVKTFTDVKTTTHDILVQAMVGRNLGNIYGYEARDLGAIRFRAKDLLASNMRYPISLEVKQGEIVGLFGLVGAGRSEFLKAIFGGVRIKAGDIYLDDKHLNIKNPIDAINAGIMLCPEDRKTEGIIAIHSVRDNINISARRNMLKSGCLINNDWEKANTANKIKALNIKTPSQHQLMMNLSGGNQQKVILGRWLSEEMKVILLDEPTRGIDVGAKHEIYKVIYDLAKLGICVIFASSDLPEALGLADRIIVMREGLISGELHHHEATESIALSLAMPES